MPERLIVVGAENTELIISLKSRFPDLKIILVPLVFSNFLHRNEIGYRLAFNSVELSDLVVCFSASEQEWISQCINKYSPEFNSLLSKKIELVKLPISVNYLASHSLPYLTPDNYICIVASQNVKFESVELFHNQSNKPALSSILNLLSDSIARVLAEKFDQHNFVHLYEDGYIVYSNGIRVGENSSCTRTDRLRLFANSYLTIDLNVYSTLGKETFEALLFSTPVIALEGTVASEYLRKSNGGLWVNSISELNRGLEFILSQPTTAKILGKQGKAWVENNLIEPNKFIKSVNKLIRF
jgi:glycosyltransferase involved in cell wall biosynthesis